MLIWIKAGGDNAHAATALECETLLHKETIAQRNNANAAAPRSPVHGCAAPPPAVAAPMAAGAPAARVQELPYSPKPRFSFLCDGGPTQVSIREMARVRMLGRQSAAASAKCQGRQTGALRRQHVRRISVGKLEAPLSPFWPGEHVDVVSQGPLYVERSSLQCMHRLEGCSEVGYASCCRGHMQFRLAGSS